MFHLIAFLLILKFMKYKIKYLKYMIILNAIPLVLVLLLSIILTFGGIIKKQPTLFNDLPQQWISSPTMIFFILTLIYFIIIYRSRLLHIYFKDQKSNNKRSKSVIIYLLPIIAFNCIFILNGILTTPQSYVTKLIESKSDGTIPMKRSNYEKNFFGLIHIKGVPGFFKKSDFNIDTNYFSNNIIEDNINIVSQDESSVLIEVISARSTNNRNGISSFFVLRKNKGTFKLAPYLPEYSLDGSILSILEDKYSQYINNATIFIKKNNTGSISTVEIDNTKKIDLSIPFKEIMTKKKNIEETYKIEILDLGRS